MKRSVVRAVDHMSFSIEKGEILAIVGESGSGKSVTSLSIIRLLQHPGRVTEGAMFFKGTDLATLNKRAIADVRGNKISMIFQEPMTSLNPVYRIGDQLVESIRTHLKMKKPQAQERAVDMLRLVGIPSPEKRMRDYPHQLSGGMRQRVMTAMALCCDPELLIADEPTTALDVTVQAQILDLILKLREQIGMAVLLITHDLGVVAETADRVIVMYCGQAVEEALAASLFDHPRHPYTLGLLKSIPGMDDEPQGDALYVIPGMVPNPLNMPPGCNFAPRCSQATKRCKTDEPSLYTVGDHKVRCFLYAPDGEDAEGVRGTKDGTVNEEAVHD
ncbi:MAG: ABC transporter ATP-binding protein [Coriobacteriales bacterium]|nr:ABC transporter ATP-binding protein [Coriobacteriales bacterium]